MPRDIKIRALLDDKVTAELAKIKASVAAFGSTTSAGMTSAQTSMNQFQSSLSNLGTQSTKILSSTGGNGLVMAALYGKSTGKTVSQMAASQMASLRAVIDSSQSALSRVFDRKSRGEPLIVNEVAGALQSIPTPTGKAANAMSNFATSTDKAGSAVEKSVKSFSKLYVVLAAMVATGTIAKIVKEMAALGESIDEGSQRLGVSTTEFQELSFAAQQSGTSIESIQTSFRMLSEQTMQAVQGNQAATNTFRALGVSYKDASGNIKEPIKLFKEVLDGLGKVNNATVRNSMAQKMFGRSYQDLIPLMNQGTDALTRYGEEAHIMGAIISEDAVIKLSNLKDTFEKLGVVWDATMAGIVASNAGMLTRWSEGLIEIIPKIKGVLSVIPKLWETYIRSLYALFQAFSNTLGAFGTTWGSVLIMGFARGIEGGLGVINATIGKLLPEGMKNSLKTAEETLKNFSGEMAAGVGKSYTDIWDNLKVELDKINQIWEDNPEAQTNKKTAMSLEELLKLLTEKKQVKQEEIDMDLMWLGTFLNIHNRKVKATEKEIDLIDKKIAKSDKEIEAQERLSDIAIEAASVKNEYVGESLRLLSEESDLIKGLKEDYAAGGSTYEEYMRGIANVSTIYFDKQKDNILSAFDTGLSQASELFDSVAGFMSQLSANHLKEIDRWEERERERIDNSMLAEEYKEAEYEKLEKRAEKRRKDEFEEQKAMQLAMAVINTAAGVAQELSKGTVGIVTGLVIAAAGALEIATIAASSYAQGGIVPGSSYTGDRVPIRVNSGEAILTREDQSELLGAIRSGNLGGSVSISSPITINGNTNASTMAQINKAHERHLEDVRSAIMELNYRGRLNLAA